MKKIPSLPSFFLLGDSISVQYTPYLKERLAPWSTLSRKDGKIFENPETPDGQNGGDSSMCHGYLVRRIEQTTFNFDWVLLNSGLHDIKRNLVRPFPLHMPPEKYEMNLNNIFLLMQRQGILICWISTTPVFEEIHNKPDSKFHRFHADVMYYNSIAEEQCRKHNVPIIDLYGFTLPRCPDVFCDHVHFNEAFRDEQAAFIARELKRICK